MICTICQKEIILRPSAQERARKTGGTAADYTRLFTTHANCQIEQRSEQTLQLIKDKMLCRSPKN